MAPLKRPPRALTTLQRLFIEEYLVSFNAMDAAGKAGYSRKNRNVGNQLVHMPVVAAEIQRRCLSIQAKLEINADDVRRGFARIATDPREEAAGGPSFEARINALDKLAKLLGMYTQKIHVTGSVTLVDLLLAADARVVSEQEPKVLNG